MTKKEILAFVRTFYPDGILIHRCESLILAESVRQLLIMENPDFTTDDIVKNIKQTIRNLDSIKKEQEKRRNKAKIRKLEDDIRVYENTLVGMRARLDKLKNP
jgi:hypothetical protein